MIRIGSHICPNQPNIAARRKSSGQVQKRPSPKRNLAEPHARWKPKRRIPKNRQNIIIIIIVNMFKSSYYINQDKRKRLLP